MIVFVPIITIAMNSKILTMISESKQQFIRKMTRLDRLNYTWLFVNWHCALDDKGNASYNAIDIAELNPG